MLLSGFGWVVVGLWLCCGRVLVGLWLGCGCAVVVLWSGFGMAVVGFWYGCGRVVVGFWLGCGRAVVVLDFSSGSNLAISPQLNKSTNIPARFPASVTLSIAKGLPLSS